VRFKLHPATLLLVWFGLVLFLQSLSAFHLAWAAALALPSAAAFARARVLVLIRRARWLLLSIAILFALATPGERLPGVAGDLGVTYDGLILGAEHVLRLLSLLATLALLHQHLGTGGVLAGLYWLLTPLARLRGLRERIVVRLMLVLEYVETPGQRDWRSWLSAIDPPAPGPQHLDLAVERVRQVDWVILTVLAGLAVFVGRGGGG
jgi:hypothetical protein